MLVFTIIVWLSTIIVGQVDETKEFRGVTLTTCPLRALKEFRVGTSSLANIIVTQQIELILNCHHNSIKIRI